MTVVKLGRKGQLSFPNSILTWLRVVGEQLMLVDATDDGAIVLRPAGIYSIELYSYERVREFLHEDALPTNVSKSTRKALIQRGRR